MDEEHWNGNERTVRKIWRINELVQELIKFNTEERSAEIEISIRDIKNNLLILILNVEQVYRRIIKDLESMNEEELDR